MSTTSVTPGRLTPGDVVRFVAPSGRHRQGRITDITWDPQVHAHDRYRITVAVAGTTLTITPAELL